MRVRKEVNKVYNNSILFGNVSKIEQQTEARSVITIDVRKDYKNIYGKYDVDSIPVTVYGKLAVVISNHCKVGSYIGIKGHLRNNDDVSVNLVADKVTFISNQPTESTS